MLTPRLDKTLWLFGFAVVSAFSSYAYGHSGALNQAALDVCQDKARSDACQYQGHHHDVYIGTCQYISDEDLMCVRNKPIQIIQPEKHDHAHPTH